MVKHRRVVVLSPRRRLRLEALTCLVVPFSTLEPRPVEPFHVEILPGRYRFFREDGPVWAKADQVGAVSLRRLDRIRLGGVHMVGRLAPADLEAVRDAVRYALGLSGTS